MSRELFGTDGVRGLAGQYPLDQAGATTIGRAVGMHFATPGQQVVMAADPRESSAMLVASVTAGLLQVGVDVVYAGVLPTPGLAYLTREGDFAAGVMITASHNPVEYNGIKVFDEHGDKLSDETEATLNKLIVEGVEDRGTGQATTDQALIKIYEDFLVASAEGLRLTGLRLAIDSANGAASGLATRVFERLGAEVTALSNKPDGHNINADCGATHPEKLTEVVVDSKLNLGIALDGDADRVLLIDEDGREVKGDYIMYIMAVAGGLKGVVATEMSNQGFEQALLKKDITLERTKVGDRYVLEGLSRTGYKLGGEQSGHIIMPDLLATGDGLLAAVRTVKAVGSSGKSLATWCDEVELLPQALVNFPLADKARLELPEAQAYVHEQADKLAGTGRIIIRPSGTEPLARVMVEAPDAQALAEQIATRLKELVS